jgi:hypothetical protein
MLRLKTPAGYALYIPVELIQTVVDGERCAEIHTYRGSLYEIHHDCIGEVVAAMEEFEKRPNGAPSIEEKMERIVHAFDTKVMPRLAPILAALGSSRVTVSPATPPKPS